MKRFLLLICLFSINSASFSQINKGQWLMGGNASFSSSKGYVIESGSPTGSTNGKSTTLQLSPNAGYFITDKLAAGARVSLTSFETKSPNDVFDISSTQVSLSPFVRYYFLPKTEKLNLFADAGYAYGRSKNTSKVSIPGTPSSNSTSKGTSNGYYISVGPAIFLNPNTALELTLSYNYNKLKDLDNTGKSFLVGVGFQINL
jgi:hypothetical protein